MPAADALLLGRAEIASLIPHSGTMCLLDGLLAWSDAEIVCRATGHRDPAHPLRTRSGLSSACAIEYAAQAMALHGALRARAAGAEHGATPGFLVSARGVQLACWRLDERVGPLRIGARRLAGDERQLIYQFDVTDGDGERLAEGRATVILNTPLGRAAPTSP